MTTSSGSVPGSSTVIAGGGITASPPDPPVEVRHPAKKITATRKIGKKR